jgi:hypothetical protein
METQHPIALQRVLEIERAAYPEYFQHMQEYESWDEVAECYAQVRPQDLLVLSDGESWYLIAACYGYGRAYIMDRAKMPGSPKMDWIAIYEELIARGIRRISGDMRETTSYKRFQALREELETKLNMQLVHERSFTQNGETMHAVEIYFAPQRTEKLKLDNRKLKDSSKLPRKNWDFHPEDGGIPIIRGRHHPIYLRDLNKTTRGQGLDKYIEECLLIDPNALDSPAPQWANPVYFKLPAPRRLRRGIVARRGSNKLDKWTYDPNKPESEYPAEALRFFKSRFKQRERAVERRDRALKHLLKAGWRKIRPEDWVGGRKLFKRFFSFYMTLNTGVRLANNYRIHGNKGSNRTLAFELWLALGMPSGYVLTKPARDHIKRFLYNEYSSRRGLISVQRAIRMLRDIPDSIKTSALVWQLVLLGRPQNYSIRDQKKIARALANTNDARTRLKLIWVFRHYAPIIPPAERRKKTKSSRPKSRTRRVIRARNIRGIRGIRRVHPMWRWRRVPFGIINRELAISPASRNPFLRPITHLEHVSNRNKKRLRWDEIDSYLAISDIDFLKQFSPSAQHGWLYLYGRIPSNSMIAHAPTDVSCSIELKLLIMVAKELTSDRLWNAYADEIAKEKMRRAKLRINELKHEIQSYRLSILEKTAEWRAAKCSVEKKRLYKDISNLKRYIKNRKAYLKQLLRNKKKHTHNYLVKEITKRSYYRTEFDQAMGYAAVALAVIFGHNWMGWLKRMQKRGSLHEATHWLPFEPSPGLAEYLTKHWQADIGDLGRISRRWNDLDDDQKTYPVKMLIEVIEQKRYKNVSHVGFAREAGKAGIDERQYEKIESQWLSASQTEQENLIPSVTASIDGLTMRKLERDDPRGVFAGIHSGCCQHPTGVAKQCAWHATKSPYGAIYVIEDADNNIVAQSWTWRNKNTIVFDSIESKDDPGKSKRIDTFYKLYESIARKMIEAAPEIVDVRCGRGMKIKCPFSWTQVMSPVPLPADFPKSAYSDAKKVQYSIFPATSYWTTGNSTNGLFTFTGLSAGTNL